MANLGLHQTLPDRYWYEEDGVIAGMSRVDIPAWKERWNGAYPYPGTLPDTTQPAGGDNGGYIRKEWIPFIKNPLINPDPRAWPAVSKINAGWANKVKGNDDPTKAPVIYRASDMQFYTIGEIDQWGDRQLWVEGITAISDEVWRFVNLVNVLEWKNGAARIETLGAYDDLPPDPEKVNPLTHRHLFFLFTSSVTNNQVGLVQGVPIYLPLLSRTKDEAWITGKALKPAPDKRPPSPGFTINEPSEEPMEYSYFVDVHPTYNYTYQDDGIDEGWPLHGFIQKVIDGLEDYTHPGHYRHHRWLHQFLSFPTSMIRMAYGYYRTAWDGISQLQMLWAIVQREGYDGGATDFEAINNEITDGEIMEWIEACMWWEQNATKPLWKYTNGWIFETIEYLCLTIWKGKYAEWFKRQEWWLAGGRDYGKKVDEMPAEDGWFAGVKLVARQILADKDELSDELDVGEDEEASIDYNRVYIEPYNLWRVFDKGRLWELRRNMDSVIRGIKARRRAELKRQRIQ